MEAITEERIKEITQKYLEENKETIDGMIEAKVSTAVKRCINSFFTSESYGEKPYAEQIIMQKVEDRVNKAVDEVDIDKEEIKNKVQKKVNTEINKVVKSIGIKDTNERKRGWI